MSADVRGALSLAFTAGCWVGSGLVVLSLDLVLAVNFAYSGEGVWAVVSFVSAVGYGLLVRREWGRHRAALRIVRELEQS